MAKKSRCNLERKKKRKLPDFPIVSPKIYKIKKLSIFFLECHKSVQKNSEYQKMARKNSRSNESAKNN